MEALRRYGPREAACERGDRFRYRLHVDGERLRNFDVMM